MLTGYDASAHVAEETKDAAVNASKAMVRSVDLGAGRLGHHRGHDRRRPVGAYDDIALVGINSAPTLFEQAVGGNMAKLLVFTAVLGQFFCGMFGLTSLSRTVYAMSRDGGIPGQRTLEPHQPEDAHAHQRRLVRRHRVRIAGLLSLLQKDNYSYAFAFVAITGIGLYTAYVTPVFLRLRNPDFRPGPWNLGRWSCPWAGRRSSGW